MFNPVFKFELAGIIEILHAKIQHIGFILRSKELSCIEPVEQETSEICLPELKSLQFRQGYKISFGRDITNLRARILFQRLMSNLEVSRLVMQMYIVRFEVDERLLAEVTIQLMKVFNQLKESLTISDDIFIQCSQRFLLNPLASTDDLSDSTLTTTLRSNQEIEPVELHIDLSNRAYVLYRQVFHLRTGAITLLKSNNNFQQFQIYFQSFGRIFCAVFRYMPRVYCLYSLQYTDNFVLQTS